MVFDAHDRAFAFFQGACARGIYDNMKTAVEAVLIGKDRKFNRRFLRMCSHYLVEPTACTPAAGWEKGQVENQVGVVRERFFKPRLSVLELRRAECVAARSMRIICQSAFASRIYRPHHLGCIRGGAVEPRALCWTVRWISCATRPGVEALRRAADQSSPYCALQHSTSSCILPCIGWSSREGNVC